MWRFWELAMSSTRDFKSPGIFAEDATTAIPPTPISGVAYRDAVSGTDDVPNGWRFGTRVESQDWNQIMFLVTSMLEKMDKKGVLGWSDLVDYTEVGITFGSNGVLYQRTGLVSGPGTPAGARDPISSPTYWTAVPTGPLGTSSEMATGTSAVKAPSIAAVMSLFAKRSFNQNDYIRIPDVPGGLIIQWFGIGSDIPAASSIDYPFPIPFPSQTLRAISCPVNAAVDSATPISVSLDFGANPGSTTQIRVRNRSSVATQVNVLVFGN